MNPIGGTTTQTQNPLTPYSSYRDCSQGVCTIYCPQWCYLIFPPPPFGLDDGGGGGDGRDFSPLIIALAGVLAGTFILVTYYILVSKYCKRRSNMVMSLGFHHNEEADPPEPSRQGSAAATGLDESFIRSISVFKYEKTAPFSKDCSDCSVCLSEFQENETLRLLPKCSHAFHVACIDTWLKSHSSCPLCRADIKATDDCGGGQSSRAAALEYRRRNDHVLVIRDLGNVLREQTVFLAATPKVEEGLQETDQRVLRIDPPSVGSSVSHSRICIAEVLSIGEEE